MKCDENPFLFSEIERNTVIITNNRLEFGL